MRELSPKELEEVDLCGRVGFTYLEVAYDLKLPIAEVKEQFVKKSGEIFDNWMHGRMQAELEIRQKVLDGAKNGSTPMLEKMLLFFKRADDEHRELFF